MTKKTLNLNGSFLNQNVIDVKAQEFNVATPDQDENDEE